VHSHPCRDVGFGTVSQAAVCLWGLAQSCRQSQQLNTHASLQYQLWAPCVLTSVENLPLCYSPLPLVCHLLRLQVFNIYQVRPHTWRLCRGR